MEGPPDALHPSSPEHESDEEWNSHARRGETEVQRLDRNWGSLIQELRVLQTGVQLLSGFLMIVPFQAGFSALHDGGRVVYLITVTAAIFAVVILLAPISMHRILFRHHQLAIVVRAAHRYALLGMVAVAISIAGAFAMVVLAATKSGWGAGAAAGSVLFAIVGLWIAIPLRTAQHAGPPPGDTTEGGSRADSR